MANEITLSSNLTFAKNGVTTTSATTAKTTTLESTLAGNTRHVTQSVGTSAEDLDLTDIDVTKEYMVRLRNTDPTNYVQVILRKDATPTDVTAFRMRPGDPFGTVRCEAQSGGYPKLRLQANTAACLVEVNACEAGDPAA